MFVVRVIVSAVELASKGVQHDLDEIQRHLNEFLAAEEHAMKERIWYAGCYQLLCSHLYLS